MTSHFTRRMTACGLLALSLAGCGASRDPAAEERVEVTPGMYSIATTGQSGGFAMPDGPGTDEDEVCLMEGQQEGFPARIAERFRMQPSCSHQPQERVGNAVAGAWRCPTDPQRAPGGSWNIAYTGAVSAEEVALTGQMDIVMPGGMPGASAEDRARLADGEAALESVQIVITATRTGDCG